MTLFRRTIPISIYAPPSGVSAISVLKTLAKKRPFAESNGFMSPTHLREDRVSSVCILPLKRTVRTVSFENHEPIYTDRGVRVLEGITIVATEKNTLEFLGVDRPLLASLKTIIGMIKDETAAELSEWKIPRDSWHRLFLSSTAISRCVFAAKEGQYQLHSSPDTSPAEVKARKEIINKATRLWFVGYAPLGQERIAYAFSPGSNRIVVYNFIRNPIGWPSLFRFLDEFVYGG